MINQKVFSKRWAVVPLQEAVEFLAHKRQPVKESERVSGPYPYYGSNGQQGTINNFLFDEPLVLLAEDGGHFGIPGKNIAYAVTGKCWVNNHAHVLRPNAAISFRYLLRVLENYDVTPFVTGTTRGKLTKGSAEKILIPLPPLEEQRRISAVLDKADELRAKRRAALAQLDTLLQSIFLDMFGDPVTNPMGWTETSLSEITHIVSGVTKGRDFKGKPTKIVPHMRVANVQDGKIVLDEIKTIEVLLDEVKRYELKTGDILLTEGGDPDKLGRGAIWKGEISPCIHQNHIFRVRIPTENLLPEYLSALIGSARGKRYFLKAAKQTTGIASINMGQLKAFPILVPPQNLQIQFKQAVHKIEGIKQKVLKSVSELDNLFHSLQQRAFNGRL